MPGKVLYCLLPPLSLIAVMVLLTGFASAKTTQRPSAGAASEMVRVEQILRAGTTTSGAPIHIPDGPLELVVAKYEIAPRSSLPIHLHHYPRYGYVISGELLVTNVVAKKSKVFGTGSVIVEDVDTWHEAHNLQDRPVELLVVDLVKPGSTNVVVKE